MLVWFRGTVTGEDPYKDGRNRWARCRVAPGSTAPCGCHGRGESDGRRAGARAAANEADPLATEDDEKKGNPQHYFVDLDTGEVHITPAHLETTHFVEVRSREQVNEVLGNVPAIAHVECFPEPSAEEAKAAASVRSASKAAKGGKVKDEVMTAAEYEAIPVAEPTEAPSD